MILHPGILALLTGSALTLLLCIYAVGSGLHILRYWDGNSTSALQYRLEQRTVLVSTLVRLALVFEVASGLLFIYTVDELHPLFVGAMCATGTLNANPVGWNALLTKIALFFAASLWLVLNHFDEGAENYPLVRSKFATLPLIAWLVGLDLYYQVVFFSGLQPEVITSCCGALFSSGGAGLAADLAGLPPGPTMAVFYGGAALMLLALGVSRLWAGAIPRILLTFIAAAFFPLALAAIISFISLYIYQMPSHHCPFDLFQDHYHYIGYPLYLCLFTAVLYGLLPGLFSPLGRLPGLRNALAQAERRWLWFAFLALLGFLALASAPILFGPLSLLEST